MCNLYQMAPKGDVERYLSRLHLASDIEDHDSSRPVGPFGAGLFLREEGGQMLGRVGQWGLIRPGQRTRIDVVMPKISGSRKPPAPKARSTNNARIEGIAQKPTFAPAWTQGRRCLVPAAWYAEPNWETGKNIWWHQRRADGEPWFLAGLWSEWVDPHTGECVPNYTVITCNCDGHPLLGRLHKPDPMLPPQAQDKRSLVQIEPGDWQRWLHGSTEEAMALIQPAPADVFDHSDAQATDALLAAAVAFAAAEPPSAPEAGPVNGELF